MEMKDMLFEKKLSGEVRFEGRIMRVETDEVELADGKKSRREVVRKGNAVCVVPLLDNGEVVFVKQFRYPYSEVMTEIPAGKMDKGEDPLECGIRELSEETGCTAERYIFLGEFYPSPAFVDEVIYMYLATDITEGESHLDSGEFLTVEKISLEKAAEMAVNGELKDGKTVTAILKAWYLKQKGEI
jgi:ADP-ribose pyrophosphatase